VVGLKFDQDCPEATRPTPNSPNSPSITVGPYHIDVQSSQGDRMHIEPKPSWNGMMLYYLLQMSVEAVGGKLAPAP
jgi:hypothetical protein